MLLRSMLLAVLLVAAPAAAGPRVAASGELPCTRDELVAALALRVADIDAVGVDADGDRVRITVGTLARELDLAGARGPAAARLIALAAAELALPELALAAPVAAAVDRDAVLGAPVGIDAGVVRALAPRRQTRLSLIGRVSSEAVVRGGVGLGVEYGSPRLRLAAEGGIAAGTMSSVESAPTLTLIGVPVRAGVVLGEDTTIRVSAVAMPFEVTGGSGDRGLLVGGGLEGRGRVRVDTVDLTFVFGVDVYANQVEYRWGATMIGETPRATFWSGLGVTWGRP